MLYPLFLRGLEAFDLFYQLIPGLTGFFMQFTKQLFLMAFRVGEVVVGKLTIFLFQFTLDLIPVSFDFQFVHDVFFFWFKHVSGMFQKAFQPGGFTGHE